MAKEERIVFIAVAETHMRNDTMPGEVAIEGFTMHHINRANEVKKGGVALYIRDDIAKLFGDVSGAL